MAYQDLSWQEFYEKAWAYRADFLKKCLRGGANSYQAIKELEKMERTYRLECDPKGGIVWQKRDVAKENSFLCANVSVLRCSSMLGQEIVLPNHFSFNFYDLLIDIFDDNGGYDCIVELGCGYGRNLFEIFYRGGARDVPYYGGEFTNSGVDIATKLAAATNGMNATFFHFDHTNPNLDIIKQMNYKRAFVFTCHTIEQVYNIPNNWFKVVSQIADHVRCIHLEPYGFQSKILGDISQKHEEFILKQGWNVNFLKELLDAKSKDEIVLDDIILEIGCSYDPYNPGSFASWHSDNKF